MKKLLAALTALIIVFTLCGCSDNNNKNTGVFVFKAEAEILANCKGEYLIDYLEALQLSDKLSFVAEDGAYGKFIVEINGERAAVNQSWLIYTDDVENSNSQWGTYEADGKTLASASVGASSLKIKIGFLYAFVLETF